MQLQAVGKFFERDNYDLLYLSADRPTFLSLICKKKWKVALNYYCSLLSHISGTTSSSADTECNRRRKCSKFNHLGPWGWGHFSACMGAFFTTEICTCGWRKISEKFTIKISRIENFSCKKINWKIKNQNILFLVFSTHFKFCFFFLELNHLLSVVVL